jgi:ribosomal protein S18 acetylase RimI-like enzyme
VTSAPEILPAVDARPARFAQLVPALVRATGPVSYDYQFGTRPGFFGEFVGAAWLAPDTLFSHSVTRVALVGDELAGIEIGFDGPEFYRLRDALGRVSAELISKGRATLEELRAVASRAEKASYLNAHIPERVYYVHALSVPERARGRGIGASLLGRAIERARIAGQRALQLDVLADNPAVRFYESMGLQVLAEARSPELSREHGFPSELRMGIAL